MTESRIMERVDRTLEAIERLEALIAKREYKVRMLHIAGHKAGQFGDIDAEESALAKNKKQLADKIASYDKLIRQLMGIRRAQK